MRALAAMLRWLKLELGSDARYQRYLLHHRAQHPLEPPLDQDAFYRDEQQRKWQGMRRCC